MPGRPSIRQSLPLTMIVPRHQPDRPEHVERHALTVVGHGDGRSLVRVEIQANDDFVRVCIIGILDQLEDRQPGTADQLVTEKLQHPGPRPERLARFTQDAVAHRGLSSVCRSPERCVKRTTSDVVGGHRIGSRVRSSANSEKLRSPCARSAQIIPRRSGPATSRLRAGLPHLHFPRSNRVADTGDAACARRAPRGARLRPPCVTSSRFSSRNASLSPATRPGCRVSSSYAHTTQMVRYGKDGSSFSEIVGLVRDETSGLQTSSHI